MAEIDPRSPALYAVNYQMPAFRPGASGGVVWFGEIWPWGRNGPMRGFVLLSSQPYPPDYTEIVELHKRFLTFTLITAGEEER